MSLYCCYIGLHLSVEGGRVETPPDVRLSLPNKETTKGTDWDYGGDKDDDEDDDSGMMTAAKVTVILNQARKEITN